MKKLAPLVVLLCAVALAIGMCHADETAVPAATTPSADGPGEDLRRSSSGSTSSRSAPLAAEHELLIVVEDPVGNGVPDADVYLVADDEGTGSRRFYRAQDLEEVIGTTDSQGRLSVEQGQLRTGGSERPLGLLVAAKGYLPKFERPDDATTIHIRLDPQAALEVHCSRSDGAPVADVTVVAARTSLAGVIPEVPGVVLPGPDARTSVATAISDLDGVATLHHLSPGSVYLQFCHDSHTLVAGWPASDFRLNPGSNRLEVTLDPLYGIHADVHGRPLLSWSFAPPSGCELPFRSRDLARVRAELDQRAHQPITAIFCARYSATEGGYQVPDASAEVSLLLDGVGWIQRRCRVAPISESTVAEILNVADEPEGSGLGGITVNLMSPSGGSRGIGGLSLRDSTTGRSIPLTPGRRLRIPAGDYRLVSLNWFVTNSMPNETVTVTEDRDEVLNLTLAADLSPVRWSLSDDSGRPIDAAQILVQTATKSAPMGAQGGLSDVISWLPIGEHKAVISSAGCETETFDLNVVATVGGDAQVIACVLTLLP